jgi:dienelactone hydrolase
MEVDIMKSHLDGSIDWRFFVISFVVALVCAYAAMAATDDAGPGGPKQEAYAPPSGQGPIVILISGASGLTQDYRSYAAEVARLGYYAVLLDGKEIGANDPDWMGGGNLKRAIEQAQRSPQALPGKAAVIGFSMGGGGALTHAAHMPDLVSAVVAYYPMTIHVLDMRSFAARFQVPILVLAGEKDVYFNCCLIESMRGMEAAAKEVGALFELVVYPNAGHAFNLGHGSLGWFRAEESADAWQRTIKLLRQYQPLR